MTDLKACFSTHTVGFDGIIGLGFFYDMARNKVHSGLVLERGLSVNAVEFFPDVNPVGICEAVEDLLPNNKIVEAAFNAATQGHIPILCKGYDLRALSRSEAKLRELWQPAALQSPIRHTAPYQNPHAPLAF